MIDKSNNALGPIDYRGPAIANCLGTRFLEKKSSIVKTLFVDGPHGPTKMFRSRAHRTFHPPLTHRHTCCACNRIFFSVFRNFCNDFCVGVQNQPVFFVLYLDVFPSSHSKSYNRCFHRSLSAFRLR